MVLGVVMRMEGAVRLAALAWVNGEDLDLSALGTGQTSRKQNAK